MTGGQGLYCRLPDIEWREARFSVTGSRARRKMNGSGEALPVLHSIYSRILLEFLDGRFAKGGAVLVPASRHSLCSFSQGGTLRLHSLIQLVQATGRWMSCRQRRETPGAIRINRTSRSGASDHLILLHGTVKSACRGIALFQLFIKRTCSYGGGVFRRTDLWRG